MRKNSEILYKIPCQTFAVEENIQSKASKTTIRTHQTKLRNGKLILKYPVLESKKTSLRFNYAERLKIPSSNLKGLNSKLDLNVSQVIGRQNETLRFAEHTTIVSEARIWVWNF